MEDYPRNQAEFEARFASEEACREYLTGLRWPDGFRCPRCRHPKGWPVRNLLVQCSACGRQTSVTAGTIFQDTRTPLTTWFRAMWCVASQKTGTSARTLHRVLGFGSYQTAWTWLHKLRRAMVRPGRERLAGRVEVDETYVGALEQGVRGRGALKKALIVIAAEEDGDRIGRIRLRRIRDASADTLQAFIDETVEPGSVVHTDAWVGYDRLKAHGYRHRITFLTDHAEPATETISRISGLPGQHKGRSQTQRSCTPPQPKMQLVRSGLALGAAVSIALSLGAVGCRASNRPRIPNPNILLITIDTLRADHLGSYGYKTAPTPALDALAGRGLASTRR